MKLYYSPRTRATRPRWALEELGVPYEIVSVDLKGGGNLSPEYLKVQPFGAVPAFEDNGTTFFESAAIVTYLADKFPQKGLAPRVDSADRGPYLQWIFFSMATLDRLIVDYFCHTKKFAEANRLVQHAEYCKTALHTALGVLEAQLGERPFIMGSNFGAADIMLGSNLIFAQALGLMDGFPRLEAYRASLSDRPAYRRAINP